MLDTARGARVAARALAGCSVGARDAVLAHLREALLARAPEVEAANALDLAAARAGGAASALIARLVLDASKLRTLAAGLTDVLALPDPLGRVSLARELADGLELRRIACPLGVLAVIFEARPEAVIQIAALSLKSGNALILKGGKEAAHSNAVLVDIVRGAIASAAAASGAEGAATVPLDAVQHVATREDVADLLQHDAFIDLVIPRGSKQLVASVKAATRIPVLGHADGICHVYCDASADWDIAVPVAVDSKTQYPAACNAAETLLVHARALEEALPRVGGALLRAGVTLHADAACAAPLRAELARLTAEGSGAPLGGVVDATASDWDTEWLSLDMSVAAVEGVEDAIAWINAHGSGHTDTILARDAEAVRAFTSRVDSAGVFVNASTRFADGFRYGFGAEVGISTNRLHARGPVGLEGLVTYKYVLEGGGHTVTQFSGATPARVYTHRDLARVRSFTTVAQRRALDATLLRRMFIVPAFEIHGGVAGLVDLGPPGCALKENVLALWRRHFVLADRMLQVDCTALTPHSVLKASGHVDKFEDLMVKDAVTGECHRADKLLEDWVATTINGDAGKELPVARRDALRVLAARAGTFDARALGDVLEELGVTAPGTGNALSRPFPFNLMFGTSIGPHAATGSSSSDVAGRAFLRPETAQGIFVNFRRLYDFHGSTLPMAVAQVGNAFRNEIAPRGGLLRVREFTMAEIEHFLHPDHKCHAKFHSVGDVALTLFPAVQQVGDGTTCVLDVRSAVASGVIGNETLGYYMARTAQFLWALGIKPEGLRFRQHLRTEMAHYATDCWDAEILMAHGWVECVGLADRSAFDLEAHSKASGVELVAREIYPEAREEEGVALVLNKGVMGRALKGDNAAVVAALEELVRHSERACALEAQLSSKGSADVALAGGSGRNVTITRDMLSLRLEKRRVCERKFVPGVIEPSFGIGRILAAIMEHSFYLRTGDEQRAVFSFAPTIAPYKAVLLPLDSRIDADTHCVPIADALNAAGVSSTIDDSSASIGKRYARSDELGTPFAVTFDLNSLSDARVTLRERDSMAQVRLPILAVTRVIAACVSGVTTWADVEREWGTQPS